MIARWLAGSPAPVSAAYRLAMAVFRPPAPLPPERPLGPIALLMALQKDAIGCWNQAHFEQPFVFGGFPFAKVVVVSEPAAIAQVLVDRQSDYCKSPLERRILSARLRNRLVAVDGEQWIRLRRILAPLFARNTTARFGPALESATTALIERWQHLDANKTVEIKTEMLRLAIDVLLHAIFGDGISDPDAVRKATTDYYSSCGRLDPFDVIGVPEFIPRLTRLHVHGILRAFDEQLDIAIVQRRRSLSEKGPPPCGYPGSHARGKGPRHRPLHERGRGERQRPYFHLWWTRDDLECSDVDDLSGHPIYALARASAHRGGADGASCRGRSAKAYLDPRCRRGGFAALSSDHRHYPHSPAADKNCRPPHRERHAG